MRIGGNRQFHKNCHHLLLKESLSKKKWLVLSFMSYCVTLGKLLTSSVSHFLSSWISINNTTYFLWLLAGWNEVWSTQRGWDGAQFVANAHSVLSTIITTIIISVLRPAPLVCPFFSLSSTFLFIGQAISRASLSEDEHPSSCRFRKCSWLFPSSDSCCCLGFHLAINHREPSGGSSVAVWAVTPVLHCNSVLVLPFSLHRH